MLIVLGAILVVLFIGGLIAARQRARARQGDLALTLARAADKGWERVMLEEAARKILAEERPGWRYDRLDLVLVDDRPGVTEDTAHFLATAPDDEVRIVLTRVVGGAWIAKIVQ